MKRIKVKAKFDSAHPCEDGILMSYSQNSSPIIYFPMAPYGFDYDWDPNVTIPDWYLERHCRLVSRKHVEIVGECTDDDIETLTKAVEVDKPAEKEPFKVTVKDDCYMSQFIEFLLMNGHKVALEQIDDETKEVTVW